MVQHHKDSVKLAKLYEINEGNVLGEGGFGRVVTGKRRGQSDLRAIKIIDTD